GAAGGGEVRGGVGRALGRLREGGGRGAGGGVGGGEGKRGRHVLVVALFFPPMGGGGVQRVTKFVKYLDACGWRSTVIAGRPEDYWMRDDSLVADVPASARVVRTAAASGLGLLRRLRQRRSRSPDGSSPRY